MFFSHCSSATEPPLLSNCFSHAKMFLFLPKRYLLVACKSLNHLKSIAPCGYVKLKSIGKLLAGQALRKTKFSKQI